MVIDIRYIYIDYRLYTPKSLTPSTRVLSPDFMDSDWRRRCNSIEWEFDWMSYIYIWSNYSDLTRPHLKWWFSKGNPLISGKSSLVKYYNLARYILDILIHLRFADIQEFIFWPLLAMVMTCTIVTRHLRNVMTHLYISGMYYCWVYFLIFWFFWKAKTAVPYLCFVLCSTASGFCFFIFWKLVHLWVTTSNEAKHFANPQFPQTWQTDDIRKASFDTPLRMKWEHITQNASCHQSTSTKLCLDYPWLSYVCNYFHIFCWNLFKVG